MPRRGVVLWLVVLGPLLAFTLPDGAESAIASRRALASVPPRVVALAKALAAHPPAASALPAGFRETGCGLRDHAIPCPVHISPYPDKVDVIYYMIEPKLGPQGVTLNYRIYAIPSAARTAFQDRRYPRGQTGGLERNARPTAGLKPYPGLLVDEFVWWFPLPRTSSYKRCYKPTVGPICWTTRAWALVGDVIVSANAGLGSRTGNAGEAIKLAKVGIQHLLEVERSVK